MAALLQLPALYFSRLEDHSWPKSHLSLSLFFFQVHKSVLEGCQLFRALKQVLFLHRFYLLSKRKATLSPLERDYWESVMGLRPEVSVLALCAKPARQALLYLPLQQTQKTIEISSYLLCLCGFWVRPSGGVERGEKAKCSQQALTMNCRGRRKEAGAKRPMEKDVLPGSEECMPCRSTGKG